MKKTLALAAIVPLVLFAVAWSVPEADDPKQEQERVRPQRGPGGHGPMHEEIMAELGISEQQQTRLEELRTVHLKEMIDLQAQLKIKRIELGALMKGYGNDAAVMEKSAEMEQLKSQLSQRVLTHQLERRAIFTAEQWEKISDMKGPHNRFLRGERGMHGGRDGRGLHGGMRRGQGRGPGGGAGSHAPVAQ